MRQIKIDEFVDELKALLHKYNARESSVDISFESTNFFQDEIIIRVTARVQDKGATKDE